MKVNSINNQQKQNFKGGLYDKTTKFLANHPGVVGALAGSSVVAQKIVMSGSEATIGPAMDIGIGKTITAATKETDGRTNESSKVQAIRTFAQSVGGTIVGVGIRLACIGAATVALSKAGEKMGGKIANIINSDNLKKEENLFKYTEHMKDWGKSVGGAIAIAVMLVTNFIIDAPFINWINKKATAVVDKISNKNNENQTKEVK